VLSLLQSLSRKNGGQRSDTERQTGAAAAAEQQAPDPRRKPAPPSRGSATVSVTTVASLALHRSLMMASGSALTHGSQTAENPPLGLGIWLPMLHGLPHHAQRSVKLLEMNVNR
jgi:hypothetical protein